MTPGLISETIPEPVFYLRHPSSFGDGWIGRSPGDAEAYLRAMKTSYITLLAAALVIAAAPAFGKGHRSKPSQPPRHDGRTVIARIGSSEIVTESPQSKRTYKIDDDTEFFYLGKKVTSSDLKKGMRVVITPSFDGLTADKIEAGDAPVRDKNSKK